jgi:intergrase/recombinase
MPSDAFAMGIKGNVVLYLDKELVEKSKELGFNLSKTFENHLKHLMTQFSTENSVDNLYLTDKNVSWCGRRDLNPGRQRGSLTISYPESKGEFVEYLQSKHFNERYARCMLSYLDKNVSELHEPMDVVRIFSKLSVGQQHNLSRALRTFLNFAELKGVSVDYLNSLRKAIPKDRVGADLNVPTESEILASLSKLNDMPVKYQALYNLLLDSGLRLIEAMRLLNSFEEATKIGNFYRCTLGFFRGSKTAYAAYFTNHTHKLIQSNNDEVEERAASHYFHMKKCIAPKYLRKFVFDTMISDSLNVPESVADFIEG